MATNTSASFTRINGSPSLTKIFHEPFAELYLGKLVVESFTASYIQGSMTSAETASYVDFADIANKPALISSSVQIISFDRDSYTFSEITASAIQVQTLHVQTITSSVVYSSGSTHWGTFSTDKHQFTGSILATGSMSVNGNVGIGTTTPTSKLSIDDGTGTLPDVARDGTLLRLSTVDAVATGIEGVAYSSTGLAIRGRSFGGTRAAPSATTDGAPLLVLNGFGYTTTFGTDAQAQYMLAADGLWSATNAGTVHRFVGTPNGSTMATEWMRLANGNLGVGTTSPVARLTIVAGDAATTSDQVRISGGRSLGTVPGSAGSVVFANSYFTSGAAAAILGADTGVAGGALVFATTSDWSGPTGAPTERVRINQDGNVGIGTTAPEYHLSINTGTAAPPTATPGVGVRITPDSGTVPVIESVAHNATGLALRARVSGGTRESPTAVPDGHPIFVVNALGYSTTWEPNPNGQFLISADGVWSATNRGAHFTWRGTASGSTTTYDWMRLQRGNLGIGVASPSAKLHVQSSGAAYADTPSLLIRDTTTRGTTILESTTDVPTDFVMKNNNRLSWSLSSRSSSDNYNLGFYPSTNGSTFGAPILTLATAGGIRFNTYGAGTLITDSSGNITATSDARMKNVSGSFTRGLNEIIQLEPKVYTWTEDSGLNTEDVNVGLIAQEVESVIPEAVWLKDDKYTMSDRPIISALINAVKELKADNDVLRSRIDSLGG